MGESFKFTDEMLDGYDELTPYEGLIKGGTIVDAAVEFDPGFTFLNTSIKPHFFGKVTQDEIDAAETRLGVTFPPSYKDFVLEHGLFQLGSGNENEFRMLHPSEMGRLSDILAAEWEVNWDDYTEEQKGLVDQIIYFSMGDEGLQMVWFYCMDFTSQNPESGEVEVLKYNQDHWQWMMDGSDVQVFGTDGNTTMHDHMFSAVSRIVRVIGREMDI